MNNYLVISLAPWSQETNSACLTSRRSGDRSPHRPPILPLSHIHLPASKDSRPAADLEQKVCIKAKGVTFSFSESLNVTNKLSYAGTESDPSRSAASACTGEGQTTPDGCEMSAHRPSVADQPDLSDRVLIQANAGRRVAAIASVPHV